MECRKVSPSSCTARLYRDRLRLRQPAVRRWPEDSQPGQQVGTPTGLLMQIMYFFIDKLPELPNF